MEILSKCAPESLYSDLLAKQLNGQREVRTPVGNIDVLTELEVIEVKHLVGWKAALGQVAAYAIYYPGHGKRIHLIGEPEPKQKDLIEITTTKVNTRVTWITPILFANHSPVVDILKAFDLSHPHKEEITNLAIYLQGYEFDGGLTIEGMFHAFKALNLDLQTIEFICQELFSRNLLLRRPAVEFNIYGEEVREINKYAYHLLISRSNLEFALKK